MLKYPGSFSDRSPGCRAGWIPNSDEPGRRHVHVAGVRDRPLPRTHGCKGEIAGGSGRRRRRWDDVGHQDLQRRHVSHGHAAGCATEPKPRDRVFRGRGNQPEEESRDHQQNPDQCPFSHPTAVIRTTRRGRSPCPSQFVQRWPEHRPTIRSRAVAPPQARISTRCRSRVEAPSLPLRHSASSSSLSEALQQLSRGRPSSAGSARLSPSASPPCSSWPAALPPPSPWQG
jgi:hypothetical protein